MKIREANTSDVSLLFEWANDSDVRSNAINTNQITWDGHQSWFQKCLSSGITKIFIFETNLIPIGQVRYEFENNSWIIDYSIDKLYRGKGFGKIMVGKTFEFFKKEERILAYVKNGNIASVKVFEALGFNETEIIEIKENKYQIFEKWIVSK